MLAGSMLIFPAQFPALVPVKSLTEGSWQRASLSGMGIVNCSLLFCFSSFLALGRASIKLRQTFLFFFLRVLGEGEECFCLIQEF